MERLTTLAITALVLAGCGEGDAPDPGEDRTPAQEVEGPAADGDVETVRLDTVPWFNEGRTVEFQGRTWILAGEPVYDPMVEPAGEFEGTPLYTEVGVTAPRELYIPLGGDYWQRLERAAASAPEAATGSAAEGEATSDTTAGGGG